MSWLQDVYNFMRVAHPDNAAMHPTMPILPVRKLCRKLIADEINDELLPALADNESIANIADGIIDSLYVLLYTAHCYGLPVEELWDEVHRSNMAKLFDDAGENIAMCDPDTGKVIKPDGWQPPNLVSIIAKHVPDAKIFCPGCGKRHHDVGEWHRRPHRTHLCIDDKFGKGCGTSFRLQRKPLLFGAGEP